MIRNVYFVVFDQVVQPEVCDVLISECRECYLKDGRLNGTNESFVDKTIRKSRVGFIPLDSWFNGLIHHYLQLANKEVWGFDISTFQTSQYSRYDEGGHYDWHKDEFSQAYSGSVPEWKGLNRKLSAVLTLSRKDSSCAGGLGIKDPWGKEVFIKESLNQGTIVVFPSYIVHRAFPVMEGKRETLTQWALGPSFK